VATQEAVPAAFAIASLHPGDPWTGCVAAAGLGGDSDTVAAITGAMLGACNGLSSFPEHAVRTLVVANPDLHLTDLADQLLQLRDRADR
jgi:ADP-ribosylglycohydrolase